jgi:hypothetical protein
MTIGAKSEAFRTFSFSQKQKQEKVVLLRKTTFLFFVFKKPIKWFFNLQFK